MPGGLLGTLIGGVGDIASLFASRKAHADQLATEKQKFATEIALQKRQTALAEQLQRQGVATRTDASGNTTYYDAATNSWKTLLTPQQQQLQDQTNAELLKTSGVDATAARDQRIASAGSRQQDAQSAQATRAMLTDQLTGRGGVSGSKVASALALARRGGLTQGLNEYGTALGTQAIRSGAAGATDIGAALLRARAGALAQGMGAPVVEGDQYARTANTSKIEDLAKLYGGFSASAGQNDSAAFQPVDITGALRGTQSTAAQGAIDATNNAGRNYGLAATTLNQASNPNYVAGEDPGFYQQLAGTVNGIISGSGGSGGGGGGWAGPGAQSGMGLNDPEIAGVLGGGGGAGSGNTGNASQFIPQVASMFGF